MSGEPRPAKGTVVGIDFGTTNSVVSVQEPGGGVKVCRFAAGSDTIAVLLVGGGTGARAVAP